MISEKLLEIGGYATSVTGPVMALAIGHALMAPPLVLYSLAAVGAACNALGGSGGPLAVFFIGIVACEIGKLVSKETKIDIIVTPGLTIITGGVLALIFAPLFKTVLRRPWRIYRLGYKLAASSDGRGGFSGSRSSFDPSYQLGGYLRCHWS